MNVIGMNAAPMHLAVQRRRLSVTARRRYSATERHYSAARLNCREGAVTMAPQVAAALAAPTTAPCGLHNAQDLSVEPPAFIGIERTDQCLTVVVGKGSSGGTSGGVAGGAPAAEARRYEVPIFESDIVITEDNGLPFDGSSRGATATSMQTVAVHAARATEDDTAHASGAPAQSPSFTTRRVRFVDLTALSTQDNTLLRLPGTGELLPPSTLLCFPTNSRKAPVPAARKKTNNMAGKRGAGGVPVKRRRIVLIDCDDNETRDQLAVGDLELVCIFLKS